mmetsp:Transcript_98610/g.284508  ORF Transcript_98610/g.284508 Transcript_98610/m.284508 type:complete len:496 (+) Transcript_98610:3-1490(+)
MVMGFVTVVVSFVAFVVAVCAVVARMFRVSPYYDYFICHHKMDAQAQARLLKIQLQTKTGRSVFVDSDDLAELDGLFDTVKTRVGTLVAYATRELLMRPWCAGEITTALFNRVGIVFVVTPSFVAPTEEHIENIASYVDWCGLSFAQYGISDADVMNAFRQVIDPDGPARHVYLDATISSGARMDAAVSGVINQAMLPRIGSLKFVVRTASMLTWQGSDNANRESGRRSDYRAAIADGANYVLVLSLPSDDEASAAAGVLMSNIQAEVFGFASGGAIHVGTEPKEMSELQDMVETAKAVLILLSPRSLTSQYLLRAIAGSMPTAPTRGKAAQHAVVPIALPGFVFPGNDFYSDRFWKVWPDAPESAAGRVSDFFKSIAVQLSTGASEQVLATQSRLVLARVAVGATTDSGREVTPKSSTATSAQLMSSPSLATAKTTSISSSKSPGSPTLSGRACRNEEAVPFQAQHTMSSSPRMATLFNAEDEIDEVCWKTDAV